MKVPRSSPFFLSAHFLALNKEGPGRVKFYRSLSCLPACVSCAAAAHATAEAQAPGLNIICLAPATKDRHRWGPAPGNHGQVGLFHFHFNFRRA